MRTKVHTLRKATNDFERGKKKNRFVTKSNLVMKRFVSDKILEAFERTFGGSFMRPVQVPSRHPSTTLEPVPGRDGTSHVNA